MPYLLDTMVVSELAKRHPNAGVVAWLAQQDARDACISTLTLGEVEAGIAYLEPSPERSKLERWMDDLVERFESRILPFDADAGRAWGRASALARRAGKTLPVVDSQLAAIAFTRGMTIVTRNVRHFTIEAFAGLAVVNPWS
jgi:predicted nucleic acid-binding protein